MLDRGQAAVQIDHSPPPIGSGRRPERGAERARVDGISGSAPRVHERRERG